MVDEFGTDPVKLWRRYIQLQQAEAAFRTSKSDLALRPVYHQKTERVEAHILICFLALALWHPGNVDAFQGARDLRASAPVGSLHDPFHGRDTPSQKPWSTAHAPRRPTRQARRRTTSALGPGAADVTKNHPIDTLYGGGFKAPGSLMLSVIIR